MERNPVEQRVVGDRPGVRGAPSQRLAVGLAGPADVGVGDLGEGHQVHAVDLNLDPADSVAPAHLGVGTPPQAAGDGDVARCDVVVQFPAELHGYNVRGSAASERGSRRHYCRTLTRSVLMGRHALTQAGLSSYGR